MSKKKNTKNDAIIDSILCLLRQYNFEVTKRRTLKQKARLDSLKYLISQSIRQYDLPECHRHLSKKAFARWNQLSSDDIMAQHSYDQVDCDKLSDAVREYWVFTGAGKEGTRCEISEDGFKFVKMFVEDHVIPVSMIFDALTEIKSINRDKVKRLLNRMHTCILLKEEDRRLGRTKGRSLNFRTTIEAVYQRHHVELYI